MTIDFTEGFFDEVMGSPRIVSDGYSGNGLELPINNAKCFVGKSRSATLVVGRVRFKMRSPQPTYVVKMIHAAPSLSFCYIGWIPYDATINPTGPNVGSWWAGQGTGAAKVAGASLLTDTWYLIDFMFDCSSSTRTIKFQLDGTAAADNSITSVSSSVVSQRLGCTSTNEVGTPVFDDLALSATASDYPLGG